MNKIKIRVIAITILISTLSLIYSWYTDYLHINNSIGFIFSLFISAYIYIKLYYKNYVNNAYQQLEILIPMINDLSIKKRLPHSRGYAASPDYLYEIKKIIEKERPKLILEVGSGLSTIISSYTLRKNELGKIISLDHDQKYGNQTIENIKKHNLEKYAKVLFAPLKEYENNLLWYDIDVIDHIDSIDMLIIDGPPSKISSCARYPALPLLINKLSDNAIIILDDASRKSEQQAINRWKSEFQSFSFNYISSDKGLCIIKKISK